ncbi:MAG: M20/M25/M40 family metallo-hydrolase, partial [Clostridiales bacterium]
RAAVGISDTDPMLKRIESICESRGMKPSKKGVCFYTDASQIVPVFKKPFVIMGPGNDSLAHQINEHVLLEDVVDMARLYEDYLNAYYFDHN